jgi:VIT1/CCC1 family predicted Fe2+/Mn2+ transporter
VTLLFTAYISVAQDIPFPRWFLEMAAISLGIAAISFVIGYLVKVFLSVEV